MMLNRNAFWVLLGFALMSMIPGTVGAQAYQQSEDWKFTFTPYAWLAGMSGSSIVGDAQQDVDLKFTDEILDNLNMGVTGDFRAEKGRWAIQTNILWAELEADATLGDTALNVEVTQWLVELDGRYRLNDVWEMQAGLRYNDMSVKAGLTGAINIAADVGDDWVDPYIGFVGSIPMNDKWTFKLGGNIGGFGVGSDFSWQAQALFDYRFGKTNSIIFGWRHLDFDYDDGVAADRFGMDVYMSGPVIGVRLCF
jgi:hypothetical protein